MPPGRSVTSSVPMIRRTVSLSSRCTLRQETGQAFLLINMTCMRRLPKLIWKKYITTELSARKDMPYNAFTLTMANAMRRLPFEMAK